MLTQMPQDRTGSIIRRGIVQAVARAGTAANAAMEHKGTVRQNLATVATRLRVDSCQLGVGSVAAVVAASKLFN